MQHRPSAPPCSPIWGVHGRGREQLPPPPPQTWPPRHLWSTDRRAPASLPSPPGGIHTQDPLICLPLPVPGTRELTESSPTCLPQGTSSPRPGRGPPADAQGPTAGHPFWTEMWARGRSEPAAWAGNKVPGAVAQQDDARLCGLAHMGGSGFQHLPEYTDTHVPVTQGCLRLGAGHGAKALWGALALTHGRNKQNEAPNRMTKGATFQKTPLGTEASPVLGLPGHFGSAPSTPRTPDGCTGRQRAWPAAPHQELSGTFHENLPREGIAGSEEVVAQALRRRGGPAMTWGPGLCPHGAFSVAFSSAHTSDLTSSRSMGQAFCLAGNWDKSHPGDTRARREHSIPQPQPSIPGWHCPLASPAPLVKCLCSLQPQGFFSLERLWLRESTVPKHQPQAR